MSLFNLRYTYLTLGVISLNQLIIMMPNPRSSSSHITTSHITVGIFLSFLRSTSTPCKLKNIKYKISHFYIEKCNILFYNKNIGSLFPLYSDVDYCTNCNGCERV